MRNPNTDEMANLAPLYEAADEAQQEAMVCQAELGARLHRLRKLCGAPLGAVLRRETGEWCNVVGSGPDGQPIYAPVIQERPTEEK